MSLLCKLAVYFCASTSGGNANVIDGDGFNLDGRTIRVWGIDAPEMSQQCYDAAGVSYDCGQLSKAFLTELFDGSTPVCIVIDYDSYGRDVSRCSINGQDVGSAMVQAGWAVDYTRFSGGAYQQEERAAQAAGLGIWDGAFDMPWDWRRKSP